MIEPVFDRPWGLVTGASSGIGEAIAEELAARGYDLMLVGRDEARLLECAARIGRARGVRTVTLVCDLTEVDAVRRVYERVRKAAASVDVLVNNAGFGIHGAFDETDSEQTDALIQVLVRAPLQLIHAFLPQMRRRGRGHIINVASVYSQCAVPYQAAYSACKAFLLSFSHALEVELRGSGVVTTVVCPGVTRTRFRSRMGQPESSRAKGMSAQAVAAAALEGAFAKRFLVIPGFGNRVFVWVSRVLPGRLASTIIGRINRWRGLGRPSLPAVSPGPLGPGDLVRPTSRLQVSAESGETNLNG